MIPNFAMDNTVEKHVAALAANGSAEWSPGGQKFDEWKSRKERGKAGAASRAVSAPKQPPPNVPAVNIGFIDLTHW